MSPHVTIHILLRQCRAGTVRCVHHGSHAADPSSYPETALYRGRLPCGIAVRPCPVIAAGRAYQDLVLPSSVTDEQGRLLQEYYVGTVTVDEIIERLDAAFQAANALN